MLRALVRYSSKQSPLDFLTSSLTTLQLPPRRASCVTAIRRQPRNPRPTMMIKSEQSNTDAAARSKTHRQLHKGDMDDTEATPHRGLTIRCSETGKVTSSRTPRHHLKPTLNMKTQAGRTAPCDRSQNPAAARHAIILKLTSSWQHGIGRADGF